MPAAYGYAAPQAKAPLGPFQFERREPGANDVRIEIEYCGICHSDIHLTRDEWRPGIFPMVPGHEIAGHVSAVGSGVSRFLPGERVGVGCLVGSCGQCSHCRNGEEQFCAGAIFTYGSPDPLGPGPTTYGGYSNFIVVDEAFVLRIPPRLPLAAAAPLLCAGITTWSPLRQAGIGAGKRVGVVGLGGLGHMAVKLAHAFRAEVLLLTSSPDKRADGLRLGASDVLVTRDAAAFAAHAQSLDLIVDTVSAVHDLNPLLGLLKTDGTLTLVGMPGMPLPVDPSALILRRRALAGSIIGGIAETQRMLDFCGEHGITCDIETIAIADVNAAYDRIVQGKVRYRCVIDLATLTG